MGDISILASRLFDLDWRIPELGIIARFVYVLPLLATQLFQYRTNDLNVALTMKPLFVAGMYSMLVLAMFIFGVTDASAFIYFQF